LRSDVVQLLMKPADKDLHFIRQCSFVRSLCLGYLNFSIYFPSLFLCTPLLPRTVRHFLVFVSLTLTGVCRRCCSRQPPLSSIWRQPAECESV